MSIKRTTLKKNEEGEAHAKKVKSNEAALFFVDGRKKEPSGQKNQNGSPFWIIVVQYHFFKFS